MEPLEEKEVRLRFIGVCRRAFSLGLQMSTGGNISIRLNPSDFLVKPSGKALVDLTPEELLICDGQGRLVKGSGKPTKEFGSHLAIYEAAPQTGAVVHYHPPYATAYAAAGCELPLPTVHARRTLQRVPLITPPGEGSPELSSALKRAFSEPTVRAALLAEHGIITAGADVTEAQNLAELVEETARVAFLASRIADSILK